VKSIHLNCHGDFDKFKRILDILIGQDCRRNSFIDLCCDVAPVTKLMKFKRKVFVDSMPQHFSEGEFVYASVLSPHPIFNGRFDVSFCLDGIEHLLKNEGYRLLTRMKQISSRQILFTPLGDHLVNVADEHPHSHKSGWLPEDVSDSWASIVCPVWHPSMNLGALFYFSCEVDFDQEFDRINRELFRQVDLHACISEGF
jgi:hypothetical protein